VKKLEQTRDELIAKFQAKLQEPAPKDRAASQEVLDQLHAMQVANDSMTAKLEAAKEKAARADQLEAGLQQAQEKITGLETERNSLNEKLQQALTQVAPTGTTTQVEELMKKNSDLTAQLAAAQADITKMRDAVTSANATASEAAAAVQLRTAIGQLQTELDQTKALLVQRTEELTTTRAELEKIRADNIRLTQSQEELVTRLNDNDRQLRAAKASTDKDNELIQQLRKENAMLRDIASKKTTEVKAQPVPPPTKPRGGFLWFKPKPAKPPVVNPGTVTVSRSETGKLTAAVIAPTPPNASPAPDSTAAPLPDAPAKSTTPLVKNLLSEARTALALHDLDTAAARFQAVLAQEPDNLTALSNLGIIYYKQNQLDQAGDYLRKAVAAAPNDSEARSVLGVVYYRKGSIEDAYNELTRAVALNPRNAEAHNYLGIVMSEKGWATAAEQEVRRAIELNPQYADAHFNLAVIYSREKTPQLELARYHYQKARDLGAERDPQLEAVLAVKPATAAEPKTDTPAKP
jgi:tetratricopeptide (TPR) repeat protein